MAIETFRFLHKMSPVNVHDFFLCFKNSTYSFRYDNLVDVPIVRTQSTVKLLFATRPNNLRKVDGFMEFKRLIGVGHRASVQCTKFNLCFACSKSVYVLLLDCFALLYISLVFNFAFIFSLLFCFQILTFFYQF